MPDRIRHYASALPAMHHVLLLLAAALFAQAGCRSAPPPEPRAYYFSISGDDDDGTGVSERPFRTVARAATLKLHPGDQILLEGGETFLGTLSLRPAEGTAASPIVIGSYGPGGRATIDAGVGDGIRLENVAGVRVQNLVVRGDGVGANRGAGVQLVNSHGSGRMLGYVRIDSVDVSGFGREGIAVRGNVVGSGFQDVEIKDCAVRRNARAGIYVSGKWEVEEGQRLEQFPHKDVRVIRCLAADNPGDRFAAGENHSGSGILLDGVSGALIEYCEATNNGAENRSREGGPVGIWCTASDKVTIQYCKSHRNRTGGRHDGGGFCLDGGVCNSVLQYNVSEENDGSGYGLYEYPYAPPATGNVVRFNVSRNDGRRNGYAGIHLWDDARLLHDAKIHDNRVIVSAAPSSERAPRALWLQSAVRKVQIVNNRFEIGDGVRLMDVAWGQQAVTFSYNAYQAPSDRIALFWAGTHFSSLRGWLSHTGEQPMPTPEPTATVAP